VSPRVLGAALLVAMLAANAHAREARTLSDIVLGTVELDRFELSPPPPPTLAPTLDEIAKSGLYRRLETDRGPIHVWVPAGYDPATAATIVFVHGYKTDVDTMWSEYRLPEQFALAGVNAMFIAAGAPDGKRAPIVWPSLTQLLAAVASRIDVAMPTKRLIAVGHSGAYRTLALWLDNEKLDSIVLLDAVYGEYRFGPWARDSKTKRLINIVYETGRFSDYMHRAYLPTATVRIDGLPLDGFPDSRVIYARTNVGHWAIVTDGIALPLSLRALDLPRIELPVALPLGLPLRCTVETVAEREAASTAAAAAKIVLPPL
jgi:hypothetical protein